MLRAAARDVTLLPQSPLGMHIKPLRVQDASGRVPAMESVFIAEIYRDESGEMLPAELAGFQVGSAREFIGEGACVELKCCVSVSVSVRHVVT